jgi:hypothetical protein
MPEPPLAPGQVVRLLDALPPPPARARPAPSFAGAALALPGAPPGSPLARSALFSSTLSQLSSLAASGTSAAPCAGADAAAGAAAVQIWPVAALAGGGAGVGAGAPSLALTIGHAPAGAHAGGAAAGPAGRCSAAGLDGQAPAGAGRAGATSAGPSGGGGAAEGAAAGAQLRLRPATVWLSLPLLQRVEAFLAPLALAQARGALARCAPCRRAQGSGPPALAVACGCACGAARRRRGRARRWPPSVPLLVRRARGLLAAFRSMDASRRCPRSRRLGLRDGSCD